MSNIFEKALNDLDGLEQDILGPDYNYYKMIKKPSEMGMSNNGNAIANNIAGLVAYTELLVSGKGNASKTGKALGDKFFMKTGAKCKDVKTGNIETRSLYINNVPDGSIPFISSGLGVDFTEFEGLIPGIMNDMSKLNPLAIYKAFMMGSQPKCQSITMETIDENNVSTEETAFVATSDINSMSPCWFKDKTNPVNGKKCIEAFGLLNTKRENTKIPNDLLIKVYYGSLGLLGLYLLYKIMNK